MKNVVILFYGLFADNQIYDWIPYSPLFVYARLKEAGFKPVLIHEFKDPSYEHIIKKYAKETLIFGVSAMTGKQITQGIEAVKLFKKYADPQTPIIWGGAHATAMPHNTLRSTAFVDFTCVGHGKDNLINFLRFLQSGKIIPADIPDILTLDYFKSSGNVRYEINDYRYDISKFPSFCFDDFDFNYLMTENRVLNYTASIGCPGLCTFCSWGGKHPWTALSLTRVLDDIEYLVNKYKLRSVWFADSELSLDKDFLLGIAQGIINRKINIYWRCNARIIELMRFTKQDYALLARSGLDRFFLGLENINHEIQQAYLKIIDPKFVYKIMENCREYDIQMMMSFIFGNPCGPKNDLEENREFLTNCQRINPHVRFQVCSYTPYPGTYMSDLAENKGYQAPQSLEEYGTEPFFRDTRILKKRIPWFTPKESDDYIRRYLKLYPKMDCEPEWNWRDRDNANK